MSKIALKAHNNWQVNTDQLLPKKKLLRKYMKNRRRWMSVGIALQRMLPCSHSVWICGNVVGPKYTLVPSVSELTSHLEAHGISQNWVSTKSNAQDGHLVKRENHILPTTQMKGACLSMKPPHQSLPNPMPYGI